MNIRWEMSTQENKYKSHLFVSLYICIVMLTKDWESEQIQHDHIFSDLNK